MEPARVPWPSGIPQRDHRAHCTHTDPLSGRSPDVPGLLTLASGFKSEG